MASPGNLEEDRKKVFEIVKSINLDNGQHEGFVAEIVSWETHTRPAAGEYPQAVINEQFPDDIDIFIGMMGSYFGSPTKNWGSGTEEEFRIAYESWEKTKTPEIMFYFSDAMASVSQIDPEQLSKRNIFQKDLQKLGIYYFVYKDVVEFQFDLLRHISSAIRAVLKNKETGKSEEAIPQESSSSLKNYSDLLTREPLLNAVTMLDQAADHMNAYEKILVSQTKSIGSLSRILVRESKNIERAVRNGKQQKITNSINTIYREMNGYSKKLAANISKLSSEFSSSILSSLRAVRMVKDNALENSMPLDGISSNVSSMRAALKNLIVNIENTESGFDEWPDDILDMEVQKKILMALHQDLVSSLKISIELLDRLMSEFT